MPQFNPRHAIRPVALEPVSGRHGAPMGWSNTPTYARIPEATRVALRRIPLGDGYDPAGYYYGMPSDLWEATPDGRASFRFRAADYREAESIVRQYFPAAMLPDTLELESFVTGYLACAEWLMRDECAPDGSDSVREGVSRGWTRKARDLAQRDCAEFFHANRDALAEYETATGRNMESAGHDFWLTRNRHGAGFWDRGHAPCLERLTKAAHAAGDCDSLMLRNGYMILT